MTDETKGSTVPRRQLGRMLTQLRQDAGYSLDRAAGELECSRQKVWRIEKGMVPVRTPDIRIICAMYRVSPEMRDVLVGLARETRAKGWWHSYGDSIPAWFSLYVGLEAVASSLRYYNADLIPGLLQTHEYTTGLFLRNRPELDEAERAKAVAVRLQRQGLLTRRLPPAPDLAVVLSEAVLRRPVLDRSVMAGQLRHLLDVLELRNVSVRVLPLSAGPPLASEAGSFVILDFPPMPGGGAAEPTTVYIEGLTGALYLDKPPEVAAYEHVWAGLEAVALDEGESKKMIKAIIGECYG